MKFKKILLALSAIVFIGTAGCTFQQEPQNDIPVFTSYREIPGITEQEINAVEALRASRSSFIYGMETSTECFILEDGSMGGFAAQVCDWMEDLFEIPFELTPFHWDDLLRGMEDHTIDFSSDLTPTPARTEVYYMTGLIAMRSINTMRLNDNQSTGIIGAHPPRYIFIAEAVTYDKVMPYLEEGFEAIFVDNHDEVYHLLASGEADIFLDEAPYEAAFDIYGGIVSEHFFPLFYTPVSLSTRNPELEPIISIIQKALDSGAIRYLTELYNQGLQQYQQHKFFSGLSASEQELIEAHGESGVPIRIGLEYDNYPLSFYNTQEKAWQGIAPDVLSEIEELTGLRFTIAHEGLTEFSELLAMLEKGEISLVSEVIPTPEREGRFLMPEPYSTDYYTLISLMDFKDLEVNEVLYLKVGLQTGTAYAETFRQWFPEHKYIVEYSDAMMALDALERGEIDLFMGKRTHLLLATNYLERPGYKVNIMFDRTLDSTFGIHLNQPELFSIIDRAQRLIDTKTISNRWTTRVFDYRSAGARTRAFYLTIFCLLLIGMVVLQVARSKKVITQMKIIEKLSLVDSLTGLPNRRSFEKYISDEWNRAIRYQTPIAVLMLDVDKFKNFNDTYGHQQGDVALKTVADAIKSVLKRSSDFAARWGGEEFTVLLPHTSLNGALYIAESIRASVEATQIKRIGKEESVNVTVSVGVAVETPSIEDSMEEIIKRADDLMYSAKQSGRNRVCPTPTNISSESGSR